MNYTKLIEILLKREGKKRQVDRAQMKEVVGIIADLYVEKQDVPRILKELGLRRKRNKK